LSTTHDGTAPVARWRLLAIGTVAVACLGFGAGFGAATFRSPASASPAAIAGLAMSEAHLAGATADLALRVDRLAGVERSFVAYHGHYIGTEALMRGGLALRQSMLDGGPYDEPLSTVLALPGAHEALAPLRESLERDAAGAPAMVALSVQLDALAISVLALGEEETEPGWARRMMRRVGTLLHGDSRAALQARRGEIFSTAREAAARGDLAAAIAALGPLDAEAGEVLSGWVDAARRRIAIDAQADRVAAVLVTFAYR
jgi:hypothetical protein